MIYGVRKAQSLCELGVIGVAALVLAGILWLPEGADSGVAEAVTVPAKSARAQAAEGLVSGESSLEGGESHAGSEGAERGEALLSAPELARFEKAAAKVVPGKQSPSTAVKLANRSVPVAPARQADLRGLLLEEAGHLSLHGEEPWKDLVEVALGYQRSGNDEAMSRWLGRAERLAVDPDDPTESSQALRAVVNGWMAARRYREAASLVNRIPDPILREQAKAEVAGKLAGQRQFSEALRLSGSLSDPQVHAAALRSVSESLARHAKLNDAVAIASRIADRTIRDDSLMRIALARAAAGDIAGGANVVSGIGDGRVRDLARGRLAEAQARRESGDGFRGLIAGVHDRVLRDQSLRRILQERAKVRRLQSASEVLPAIQSVDERALAMETLAVSQARNGQLARALSQAVAIERPANRDRALQAIAQVELRLRGMARARSVLSMASTEQAREVGLRKLAEQAVSLGNYSGAMGVLNSINSPDERMAALLSLAQIRARKGSVIPARSLLRDAQRELVRIPDEGRQARARGSLAQAAAEVKDYSEALSIVATIDDHSVRDGAYQALARKFASLSELSLARETAEAIVAEGTRTRTLDDVARTIGSRVPAHDALDLVSHFHSPREQVRFLLAVAKRS